MIGIRLEQLCRFSVLPEQDRYRDFVDRSFSGFDPEPQVPEPGAQSGKNNVARTVLEFIAYL